MMKKNCILMTLCLVLMTVGGCSANDADGSQKKETSENTVVVKADYSFYQTLDEAASKADLIIKGEVISSETRMLNIVVDSSSENNPELNPGGTVDATPLPYLVSKIKVTERYKGDVEKGDVVEIKQLGGEFEGTQYISEDSAAVLQENAPYVLFLSTYNDSPASLINPFQGAYTIDGDKLAAGPDNILKDVTLQDLENLCDES